MGEQKRAEGAMYREAYHRVETVLDEALGIEEANGSGQGIAGDVYLVVKQRDHARILLKEAISLLNFHDHAAAERLHFQAVASTAEDLLED